MACSTKRSPNADDFMKFKEIKIFNYSFLDGSRDEWLDALRNILSNDKKAFFITANPEIIMEAERNPEYKKILHKAEYLIPDGVGIQWASKRFHQPIDHVIPGIELAEMMLAEANVKGYSIISYGAEPHIQSEFKKRMSKKYPNINWSGSFHGFVTDEEKNQIRDLCIRTQPDVVLVGLGMPLQEQWIASLIDHVDKGIYMGVGGTFDVLSGEVRRAPKLFRLLKIEWIYRVLTHKRGKKKLIDIFRFVVKVLKATD